MRGRSTTVTPLAAALLAASGCTFQGPSTEDTAFLCNPTASTCPDGYTCDNGLCVRGTPIDDVDAAPPPPTPDATPGAPDAAASPPDAAPPQSQTLIFGDHAIATVRGALVDTFIDEDLPNDEVGGNDFVSVDNGPVRYGLMRVDVTAIPTGSVVESADVVLTLFDPLEDGRLEAQVLRRAWSERNANFFVADTGQSWPTPGAAGNSIDEDVVAAFDGRNQGDAVIPLDVAVVQAWVDTPGQNFGLRWRSTSPTERGAQWHSRENTVATRRPYLRVTFR